MVSLSNHVGAHAEEVTRRIDGEEVHQALGAEVVVLDDGLDGVAVFLGAHVLVGAEVGHDVVLRRAQC